MTEERTSKYPLLFYSAAALNLGIGAVFICLPATAYQLMTGTTPPDSPAIVWMFGMVVIIFGLGYAWAGRDFEANRAVVKLAAIGKAAAFIVGAGAYFAGHMTLPAFGGATMDLIYAMLFARTLGWWGRP
ncbi:MAG: hypothetical protein AAFY34_15920 [Pseudomonadota bacterium]